MFLTKPDAELLKQYPNIIDDLQEALNEEYLTWLVYEQCKYNIKVPDLNGFVAECEAHQAEELEHASYIVSKIIAFGGKPQYNMEILGKIEQNFENAEQAVKYIMKIEAELVSLYTKIFEKVEGNLALKHELKEIIAIEQEHFDDIQNMFL